MEDEGWSIRKSEREIMHLWKTFHEWWFQAEGWQQKAKEINKRSISFEIRNPDQRDTKHTTTQEENNFSFILGETAKSYNEAESEEIIEEKASKNEETVWKEI